MSSSDQRNMELYRAIEDGDLVKVRELLQNGADPNAPCNQQNMELYRASENGDLVKVRELLQNGADANAPCIVDLEFSCKTAYPLHVAKTAEITKVLLDHGANIECVDDMGNTPLVRASAECWADADVIQCLLNRGAKVHAANEAGDTALHSISDEAYDMDGEIYFTKIARMLLERGADVNAEDHIGGTPLHEAAGTCCARLTRLLLEQGADAKKADNDGNTPLHIAACCSGISHKATFEVLLEFGADVNAQNNDGDTPLAFAASDFCPYKGVEDEVFPRKHEMVWLLVGNGAKVNGVVGDRGRTPLHWILETSSHDYLQGNVVDTARLLLDNGADVHAADKEGRKPLHIACEYGNVESAQLLLERGGIAAKEAMLEVDKNGQTLLHIACKNRRKNATEVVQFLLDQGANANVADKQGNMPLRIVALGGSVAVARILLDGGARADVCDNEGKTPLHFCVSSLYANIEMARLLLDQGARVNAVSARGWTVLHVAMLYKILDIVKLLLERGGNVNVTDRDGETPLHKAVGSVTLGSHPVSFISAEVNPDVVKLLLDKGANLDAADCVGKTPLHYACEIGHYQTVQMLVAKGANMVALDSNGRTPLYYGAGTGSSKDLRTSHKIVRLLLESGGFSSLGETKPSEVIQGMKRQAESPKNNSQPTKKPKTFE